MSFLSLPSWLLFAVLALLFWGFTGITQKLSTNRIPSAMCLLWFIYSMVAVSAVLIATVPIQWHVVPTIFWLAVIGGTLNGTGVLTSFLALESGGKASIVISLISLFPLPTVAFAILVLHERLTSKQAIGIVFAIIAGIMLSQEPDPLVALPQSEGP